MGTGLRRYDGFECNGFICGDVTRAVHDKLKTVTAANAGAHAEQGKHPVFSLPCINLTSQKPTNHHAIVIAIATRQSRPDRPVG